MNTMKFFVALFVAVLALPVLAKEAPPEETHEGLRLVKDSQADLAYVLPEADFSIYQRFVLLEPAVSFRKNWARDFNRSSTRRVQERDMERIRLGMAELFMEVFTQELEKAGYPVIEEAAADAMIIRPAIVNLDVTAPDLHTPGRSRSFSTSAGSATLYIEMYDSVTGQILARAIDYKLAGDHMNFQWATPSTNRQEARRVIRDWARMLINRMDEIR